MRYLNFGPTTSQVRAQTKTVTRLLGWQFAKVGDVVQPVEKCPRMKKGEPIVKVGGPIRFVSVRLEMLDEIHLCPNDTAREGFPEMSPVDFVRMFCEHNRCTPVALVTRIEFEYVEQTRDRPKTS